MQFLQILQHQLEGKVTLDELGLVLLILVDIGIEETKLVETSMDGMTQNSRICTCP